MTTVSTTQSTPAVIRAVRAELVKLHNNTAPVTVTVLPFIMCGLVTVASVTSPYSSPPINAWLDTTAQMISFWSVLLPFIVALTTALLASTEHSNNMWKHLFALPISRRPLRLPGIGDFRVTPQQVYGRPDWDLMFRTFLDVGRAIRSRLRGVVRVDEVVACAAVDDVGAAAAVAAAQNLLKDVKLLDAVGVELIRCEVEAAHGGCDFAGEVDIEAALGRADACVLRRGATTDEKNYGRGVSDVLAWLLGCPGDRSFLMEAMR